MALPWMAVISDWRRDWEVWSPRSGPLVFASWLYLLWSSMRVRTVLKVSMKTWMSETMESVFCVTEIWTGSALVPTASMVSPETTFEKVLLELERRSPLAAFVPPKMMRASLPRSSVARPRSRLPASKRMRPAEPLVLLVSERR